MSRLILLDSSVIVDARNGKRGRTESRVRLLPQGHLLACCSVALTEVEAGLRDPERTRTEAFLSTLKFYPRTAEIALRAGLRKREWRQQGLTRGDAEVNRAAVAIHHQLGFVTDNGQHFPLLDWPLLPLPEWPG